MLQHVGFAGGASGVVGGQPLDTLRVRLQQHSSARSSTLLVWQTMSATEGWRALFKGMSYPLLASGLQVGQKHTLSLRLSCSRCR
jgi:hypothetical protein